MFSAADGLRDEDWTRLLELAKAAAADAAAAASGAGSSPDGTPASGRAHHRPTGAAASTPSPSSSASSSAASSPRTSVTGSGMLRALAHRGAANAGGVVGAPVERQRVRLGDELGTETVRGGVARVVRGHVVAHIRGTDPAEQATGYLLGLEQLVPEPLFFGTVAAAAAAEEESAVAQPGSPKAATIAAAAAAAAPVLAERVVVLAGSLSKLRALNELRDATVAKAQAEAAAAEAEAEAESSGGGGGGSGGGGGEGEAESASSPAALARIAAAGQAALEALPRSKDTGAEISWIPLDVIEDACAEDPGLALRFAVSAVMQVSKRLRQLPAPRNLHRGGSAAASAAAFAAQARQRAKHCGRNEPPVRSFGSVRRQKPGKKHGSGKCGRLVLYVDRVEHVSIAFGLRSRTVHKLSSSQVRLLDDHVVEISAVASAQPAASSSSSTADDATPSSSKGRKLHRKMSARKHRGEKLAATCVYDFCGKPKKAAALMEAFEEQKREWQSRKTTCAAAAVVAAAANSGNSNSGSSRSLSATGESEDSSTSSYSTSSSAAAAGSSSGDGSRARRRLVRGSSEASSGSSRGLGLTGASKSSSSLSAAGDADADTDGNNNDEGDSDDFEDDADEEVRREWKRILSSAETLVVPHNQEIVAKGAEGQRLYQLLMGTATVVSDPDPDTGARRTLAVLRPGDLFGEMSLLENMPVSATIIAGSDGDSHHACELYCIDGAKLHESIFGTADTAAGERAERAAEGARFTRFLFSIVLNRVRQREHDLVQDANVIAEREHAQAALTARVEAKVRADLSKANERDFTRADLLDDEWGRIGVYSLG